MIRVPPWTKLACEGCGQPYQATKNTAVFFADADEQLCPACVALREEVASASRKTLQECSDQELVDEILRRIERRS